jgi:hypothetical protein
MPKSKNAHHELVAEDATKSVAATDAVPADGPVEVTAVSTLRELEQARVIALTKGQAAAAISATLAKAKIAGVAEGAISHEAARAAAFKGSLTDAARRVAFLLRLAENETSGETEP